MTIPQYGWITQDLTTVLGTDVGRGFPWEDYRIIAYSSKHRALDCIRGWFLGVWNTKPFLGYLEHWGYMDNMGNDMEAGEKSASKF